MNSPFPRILVVDLPILLLLALLPRLLNWDKQNAMNYALGLVITIFVQMLVNISMAFTAYEIAARQAHWLSVLVLSQRS